MLYIEDILKDKSIGKIKLIAGEDGILNVTNAVTVLEVPNVTDWLVGGETLITSLYSLQDAKSQCELIEKLSKKNVASLIIKTASYVKEIDQEVLDLADKLGLPIIEMDYDLTYVELIRAINDKINDSKNKEFKIQTLFREVLYNYDLERQRLINDGKDMGIDFKNQYIQVLHLSFLNYDEVEEKALLNKIDDYLLTNKNFKINFDVVKLETFKSVIIFVMDKDLNRVNDIQTLIAGDLSKECKCEIGISNTNRGLEAVKTSYDEAKIAFDIGIIIDKKKRVYYYKDLYSYSVWFNSSKEDTKEYVQRILGEVLYDKVLLRTLSEYFDANENMKMASRNMKVHYNTFRYRLDQIKEKTGYDVFEIHGKFELYTALLGSRIVGELEFK